MQQVIRLVQSHDRAEKIDPRTQDNGRCRFDIYVLKEDADKTLEKLGNVPNAFARKDVAPGERPVFERINVSTGPKELTMMTMNIFGLRDKRMAVQHLLEEEMPHIICLQETKLAETGKPVWLPGYDVISHGEVSSNPGSHGIILGVKKDCGLRMSVLGTP